MNITPSESNTASGYCRTCASTHRLPAGNARKKAGRLLAGLEKNQSIDLFARLGSPDIDLSTAPLWGRQRGKMFGVLECLDIHNQQIWLYGFSGQFSGRWMVPGWVPPLFDVKTFSKINDPVEKEIKELGRQIARLTDEKLKKQKEIQRRDLSRDLMRKIHALYRLNNFRTQRRRLDEAIGSSGNMPTGIGDCCAPKLLNHAAEKGYTPVSLAEFYFGRSNLSGTRHHGTFYPPCNDKCSPLLGFLLCGIEA